MADEYRVSQPREFYRRFLERDLRPDGRALGETRSIVVNTGSITTAEGSALVKIGNTSVICGIKAELVEPFAEEPDAGFIVPNVELPALCSPLLRPGPPSEQAQVLSQYMKKVLDTTQCVNRKDLCIKPAVMAWVLYCDVVCLNYDGNVTDAALLAILAALRTASLPTVTVDDETGSVSCDESCRHRLPIKHLPVPLTFSLFDKQLLLVDPTSEEEQLEDGSATVVSLDDGSLCCLHMPGCGVLTSDQLRMLASRAAERGGEVRPLLLQQQVALLPVAVE